MPTAAGAFQTSNPGNTSGFVFGLTSNGANRVVSTYFGGSGYEGPTDLFVRFDSNLAALYVTIAGTTTSTDLPISNALQPTYGGSSNDSFIAQFTHLLGGLGFSTYLGGASQDSITQIAEDAHHRILVAGYTQSRTLPMVDAFQGPNTQGPCGYLMRLLPDGMTIDYATYFGGRFAGANMDVTGLEVQPTGEAIVVGTTRNAVWYTTPNATRSAWAGASGSTDTFLLRFSATTVQSYGQGVSTSYYGVVPQLSAAGDLTPGSTVHLRVQDSRAGRFGVLALGFTGPTSTPLWNGTLLVNPASLVPFLVGGGNFDQQGYWDYDVALPGGTSLSGLNIQGQAVIGTPGLAEFTPGIAMVLQ